MPIDPPRELLTSAAGSAEAPIAMLPGEPIAVSLLALGTTLAALAVWVGIALRSRSQRFPLIGVFLAFGECITTVLLMSHDFGWIGVSVPYLLGVRIGVLIAAVALLFAAKHYAAEHRLRANTERTEASLRESETRYRMVTETIADAILMIDSQSRILFANAPVERLFGYSREELIGQNLAMLIPERLRERHFRSLRRYVETGEKHIPWNGIELAGLHKNGSEVEIEVSFGELTYAAGKVFVGTMRDVTERKRSMERTRRAKEAAEAANSELEAFSYSVAHDLRTPLRAIDGFSQALLEDCGTKLDQSGRDHLERVRAAASRMSELIDDLLHLSRITRTELDRTAVDLSELVRSIAKELNNGNPTRRVELEVAEGLTLSADRQLLRLAITNLLENAWKFTSKSTTAHVQVGALERSGYCTFYIRDDGVGFDAKLAKRLFAPFQRFHRAGEFDGTGIGLATVQRVIHRHGGRIWAESTPGHGAAFYFTIPQGEI